MASAVVFAYHNVGVRCLAVLLAHGVDVRLVLTHDDDPNERIWFESVRARAQVNDIECIAPANPNAPEIAAKIAALAPDFIFSFYYRQMLGAPLLALARRGALNMHGSLLPRYRGRAPVNWAILKGEKQTGATLHYMVQKPDAGDIVEQQAVPILPDDVALEVFNKVTTAAEIALDRALPRLLDGSAPRLPQDLARGSYFGGRKPEDGQIDWSARARAVHDLVRALAPPYPGAFTALSGERLYLFRTRLEPGMRALSSEPGCYAAEGRLYADCADGGVLRILHAELAGRGFDAARFGERFGVQSAPVKVPFD